MQRADLISLILSFAKFDLAMPLNQSGGEAPDDRMTLLG
jgi:hypothetical protein